MLPGPSLGRRRMKILTRRTDTETDVCLVIHSPDPHGLNMAVDTHTHTHTLAHTRARAHTHPHTHTLSLSLSLTHTCTHTHAHTHTHNQFMQCTYIVLAVPSKRCPHPLCEQHTKCKFYDQVHRKVLNLMRNHMYQFQTVTLKFGSADRDRDQDDPAAMARTTVQRGPGKEGSSLFTCQFWQYPVLGPSLRKELYSGIVVSSH
jgi:hypothetical protein